MSPLGYTKKRIPGSPGPLQESEPQKRTKVREGGGRGEDMAERDITARVRKIVGNDGKYFRRRGSSATGVKENDPQLKAEKRRKRCESNF